MVDLVALTLSVGALHYPAGAPRDFFLLTTPLLVLPISAKVPTMNSSAYWYSYFSLKYLPTCTRFTADPRLHPLDLKST